MSDDLLKYHIDQTNKQFTDIKSELANIREDLKELTTFKTKLSSSTKLVSSVWSVVISTLTLLAAKYFK